MASKIVLDAVEARLAAEFSAVPVYLPNSTMTPTLDLSSYVTVEFPVGLAEPLTLNGVDHEFGTIRFVVHVALKAGTDDALTYADELGDIFRQTRLPAAEIIQTGSPSSPASLGDNGAFYRVSTSVPFWRFHS